MLPNQSEKTAKNDLSTSSGPERSATPPQLPRAGHPLDEALGVGAAVRRIEHLPPVFETTSAVSRVDNAGEQNYLRSWRRREL